MANTVSSSVYVFGRDCLSGSVGIHDVGEPQVVALDLGVFGRDFARTVGWSL